MMRPRYRWMDTQPPIPYWVAAGDSPPDSAPTRWTGLVIGLFDIRGTSYMTCYLCGKSTPQRILDSAVDRDWFFHKLGHRLRGEWDREEEQRRRWLWERRYMEACQQGRRVYVRVDEWHPDLPDAASTSRAWSEP